VFFINEFYQPSTIVYVANSLTNRNFDGLSTVFLYIQLILSVESLS